MSSKSHVHDTLVIVQLSKIPGNNSSSSASYKAREASAYNISSRQVLNILVQQGEMEGKMEF